MKKEPYEISIWKDVWKEEIEYEGGTDISYQYFDEEKIAIIGTHEMTTQSRALDPNLITKEDGSNEFSFKMHYYYIDIETGKEINNEYVPLLVPDRKIKVHWKDKWYDFIIKSCQKDKTNYQLTCKCVDQHIYELSKNGYSIELDTELKNNSGTVEELGHAIFKDTDWMIETEEPFYQYQRERLYRVQMIKVEGGVTCEGWNEHTQLQDQNSVRHWAIGDYVYFPYSVLNNPGGLVQFFYRPQGDIYTSTLETDFDEDNLLTPEWECCYAQWTMKVSTVNPNFFVLDLSSTGAQYLDRSENFLFENPLQIGEGTPLLKYGERMVRSNKQTWVPALGAFCDMVRTSSGEEVYCYETTDYGKAPPELIQETTGFTDTGNWHGKTLRLNTSSEIDTLAGTKEQVFKNSIYTRLQANTDFFYDLTSVIDENNFDPSPGKKYILELYMRLAVEDGYDNISFGYNMFNPTVQEVKAEDYTLANSDSMFWDKEASAYILDTSPTTLDGGTLIFPNGSLPDSYEWAPYASIEFFYYNGTGCAEAFEFPETDFFYYADPETRVRNPYYRKESAVEKIIYNKKECYAYQRSHTDHNGETCHPLPNVGLANVSIHHTEKEEYTKGNDTIKCLRCAFEIEFVNSGLSLQQLKDRGMGMFIRIGEVSNNEYRWQKISSPYEGGTTRYVTAGISILSASLFPKVSRSISEQEQEPERDYVRPAPIILGSDDEININNIGVPTRYYNYIDNVDINNKDEIKIIERKTTTPSALNSRAGDHYYSTFKQVRLISGKQSNRFDLLQSLLEQFEGYSRFEYGHNEDGSIEIEKSLNWIDGNLLPKGIARQKKRIVFTKQIGKQKDFVFEYGVDLKNIQRTVESSSLITKLYCSPIENEHLQNQTCEISFSKYNLSGENFIINFEPYYINGILNKETVQPIVDFTNKRLFLLNQQYREIVPLYNEYKQKFENAKTNLKMLHLKIRDIDKTRLDFQHEINKKTYIKDDSGSFHQYSSKVGFFQPVELAKRGTVAEYTWESGYRDRSAYNSEADDFDFYKSEYSTLQSLYLDSLDKQTQATKLASDINAYVSLPFLTEETFPTPESIEAIPWLETQVQQYAQKLEDIIKQKEEIWKDFENKFIRFIHEGVWSPRTYLNNDQYYLDAEYASHINAKPKTTYTINAIRLSALPEFEWKSVSVGDIMYIKDPDFFGYDKNDQAKKEKVVISEISAFFDSPSKDTFKIKNHRSRFDTLMQKLFQAK